MQLQADVEAIFMFSEWKKNKIYNGYCPEHLVTERYLTTGKHNYYNLEDNKGELKGSITFLSPEHYPASLWVGKQVAMFEGKKEVGYAIITQIFNPLLCKDNADC